MISIVIPLYNKAHTIVDTLTSVLNQTFDRFEVIIINDGSTDNSVEVINNFTVDERIRIFHQPNQGVSVARNEGVAKSNYQYIAFLDGDDQWLPTYLSKMKEAIDQFPLAGMYCSAGIVRNTDGSQNSRINYKYQNQIVEIDFFENPHVYIHTSATIVLKEVFNKTIGFPKGIWDEDFYLFFTIALRSKVIYSGFMLSIYVGGVTGQSTSIVYKEDGSFRKDPVHRHNLLYKDWLETGKKNINFLIFLKYELRHTIKTHLKNNDFLIIEHLFKNLIPSIWDNFSSLEKFLYKNKHFKNMALIFILFTKLRWRIRGYPRIDISSSKLS